MIFGKRQDEDVLMFVIRWTARVLSIAVIFLLVLFMFGEEGGTRGISGTEWAGLLFFPIGVAIGFIYGWKNELIGGAISAGSLACFYVVYGLALTGHLPGGAWFAIFTMPGFLFLLYGALAAIRAAGCRPHPR